MRSQPAIRVESLTDQVYSLLEREIVAGRMKPGERIREKELAERLGIGQRQFEKRCSSSKWRELSSAIAVGVTTYEF